jgi:N-acetylmuramic acid 6-phosphate (MurNAc-6-P) etherase
MAAAEDATAEECKRLQRENADLTATNDMLERKLRDAKLTLEFVDIDLDHAARELQEGERHYKEQIAALTAELERCRSTRFLDWAPFAPR